MVAVAEGARRYALEEHVVFAVGRGDDDHARRHELEDCAFQRQVAVGVDMLDDLTRAAASQPARRRSR